VFLICLGIHKSTEQNSEGKKKIFVKTREGAPEAPPLGSRGLKAKLNRCVFKSPEELWVIVSKTHCIRHR